MYYYPILLDAATAVIIRKGDKFFVRWADIMTGSTQKYHLLYPEIVIAVGFEMFLLLFKRLFVRQQPNKRIELKI